MLQFPKVVFFVRENEDFDSLTCNLLIDNIFFKFDDMNSKQIEQSIKRCAWVNPDNPLYCHYHDEEWGVPLYDDHKLFEAIVLDGAQAGLSWETILNKRENYRSAFDNFDPQLVAKYNSVKIEELLQNSGIVRNRLKIKSAIKNARVFLDIQIEFGSFNHWLWNFVEFKPIQNQWRTIHEIPASTLLSEKISKELKKLGMNFVGPTIIYAMMQAVGMVNDHTMDCFRYNQVGS